MQITRMKKSSYHKVRRSSKSEFSFLFFGIFSDNFSSLEDHFAIFYHPPVKI